MDAIIQYFQTLEQHPLQRLIILVAGLLFFWIIEGQIPFIKLQYKKNKVKDPINISTQDVLEDQDVKFLDKIWEIYGEKDGIYLSAITHTPETPWRYSPRRSGATRSFPRKFATLRPCAVEKVALPLPPCQN